MSQYLRTYVYSARYRSLKVSIGPPEDSTVKWQHNLPGEQGDIFSACGFDPDFILMESKCSLFKDKNKQNYKVCQIYTLGF